MSCRPQPDRSPAPDRGLTPLVSILVLLLVTGVVAVGVHLWVGEFTVEPEVPRFDAAFTGCDEALNTVDVRLVGPAPIPFRALNASLWNSGEDWLESRFSPIPLRGAWQLGTSVSFGDPTVETGVAWPDPGLRSTNGLVNTTFYELRFDHHPTGERIDTLGFHCK